MMRGGRARGGAGDRWGCGGARGGFRGERMGGA